jgi:hypothetical protein
MRLTTYTPANEATRERVERLYDLVLADESINA